MRAEFALKADQEVVTEQRLKGSCPFLFAWNGKDMKFVKDTVPLGPPSASASTLSAPPASPPPRSGTKSRSEELAPRNGPYDLRITGELWETYYYDWLR